MFRLSCSRPTWACFLSLPLALSILVATAQRPYSGNLVDHGCNSKSLQAQNARRQVNTGAREGADPGDGAGLATVTYSCDPTACLLPDCHCADTNPPGDLSIEDVPQFITVTADDAVQTYTLDAINSIMGGRKNPNGCPAPFTYFVSLNYTNYSLVTDTYVLGHEIADHTMQHVGAPPENEISGNLIALNALSGIPFSKIAGFRAPFLKYTADTLETLYKMNFTYDSSSSSSVRADDPNTDAFWPYTLDSGLRNDCLGVEGVCNGGIKLTGMWEIPMYSVFDDTSANGAHLMDPWLDGTANDVLIWMQQTFLTHYNGKKQPFGLYTHPIHLSTDYPGLPAPTAQLEMINHFLDWATLNSSMPNVWFVTNQQLLAWMRNPVKASELNTLTEFKCQVPDVKGSICNGMPDLEKNLLQHCINDTAGAELNQSPFYTCYGCPAVLPHPDNPNPPQANVSLNPALVGGEMAPLRFRISDSCDTPFWDPVSGICLNAGFNDQTRSIGPNGQNLAPQGGTNAAKPAGSGSVKDPYTSFNAARSRGENANRIEIYVALLGLVCGFHVVDALV